MRKRTFVKTFQPLLEPWAQMANRFRADDFYERFPVKGQLERTTRIYKELVNSIGALQKV